MDEGVRAHKHRGKARIRFKAMVHSGNLFDSLNDCVTRYTLWLEEQQWLRKGGDEDDDPNLLSSRMERAAQCLLDTGLFMTHTNSRDIY